MQSLALLPVTNSVRDILNHLQMKQAVEEMRSIIGILHVCHSYAMYVPHCTDMLTF